MKQKLNQILQVPLTRVGYHLERDTAKDLVKMLEKTGTKVSIFTAKRVLYQHNLKDRSARKEPLLQNRHKKDRLRFATAHGDKDLTFWRNVL
uniref:Transposase Tc1-like domain-containing protein n=1 Tax=Oncorhynchus tshawytscha TaxID=74940 RepID=A0A8C8K1I2_ONCTS